MLDLITPQEVYKLDPRVSPEEVPLFKGAMGAIPGGIAFGAGMVADVLGAPVQGMAGTVFGEDAAQWVEDQRESMKQVVRDNRPNPYRTGTAGQFIHSIGSVITEGVVGSAVGGLVGLTGGAVVGGAVAGPVGVMALAPAGAASGAFIGGASAVGAAAGYGKFIEPELSSVDETTRAKLAAISATVMGAGAVLPPFLGRTLGQQIATGVGLNVGLGMVERGTSGAILEAEKYDKIAAHYKALDATAMVTDAVLGAVFPAGARLLAGKVKPTVEHIDSAMVLDELRAIQTRDAGIPKSIEALDVKSQSIIDADMQLLVEGKNIFEADLPKTAADEIPNPEFGAAVKQMDTVIQERLETESGESIAVHQKNVDEALAIEKELQDAVQARVEPEVAAPKEPAAPAKAEEEITPESFTRQEASRAANDNPDMMVSDGMGNRMTAKEMVAAAAREAVVAKEDASLHEVAMACALNFGA
jgi:hypothetical protein